jgi:hypothetical protein
MNIVFGRDNLKSIDGKNTVLTVDSFKVNDEIIECFCLLSIEDIPLSDLPTVETQIKLHESLVAEYRKKNWNYCLDAIGGLRGNFNGVLNEFYDNLESRILQFVNMGIEDDWHWALDKA